MTKLPDNHDTQAAAELIASHDKPTKSLKDLVSEFMPEPLSKTDQYASWGKPALDENPASYDAKLPPSQSGPSL